MPRESHLSPLSRTCPCSARNANFSRAPPSMSSNPSTSILSNHPVQTMRAPTLEVGARFEASEPASRHGAQLEVPPHLGPRSISLPSPHLERIINRNGINRMESLPSHATPTLTSPVPPTIFLRAPAHLGLWRDPRLLCEKVLSPTREAILFRYHNTAGGTRRVDAVSCAWVTRVGRVREGCSSPEKR